jgi:hypothetical protein
LAGKGNALPPPALFSNHDVIYFSWKFGLAPLPNESPIAVITKKERIQKQTFERHDIVVRLCKERSDSVLTLIQKVNNF